ncbi:MAG: histidine phosphatase family protein [Pseudomonadota bacterium]
MIEIGLVRHFPTDWNAAGKLQGRRDIPLSAEARIDLARHSLPQAWRGRPVVASPLSRARETAAWLADGPVRLEERLQEVDFGLWEGRTAEALRTDPAMDYRPIEAWGWAFAPPGGESVQDLALRLRSVLAEIETPSVLVTHRGVIRCILALATGWTYRGPAPFRIKRASLHPVSLSAQGAPIAIAPPIKLDRGAA